MLLGKGVWVVIPAFVLDPAAEVFELDGIFAGSGNRLLRIGLDLEPLTHEVGVG